MPGRPPACFFADPFATKLPSSHPSCSFDFPALRVRAPHEGGQP
jgi:hypothetical protein